MLSNEHRAHDLTMLYVQRELRLSFEELQNSVEERDPYSLYLEIYPKILAKVNHDFVN